MMAGARNYLRNRSIIYGKSKREINFSELLVALVILGGIYWSVVGATRLWGSFFGEREGIIKYDDCRAIVTLQPDTLQKYYRTFTCGYNRTKSGKIMSGECVRIVNDKSFFSSSHTCATAYVYEKEQEGNCTDPARPYLTYDDMCSTVPQ